MNAAERIVEIYFQQERECFTVADVKIEGGNNRQFDLLAWSPTLGTQYHVEIGVTHELRWNSPVVNSLPHIRYKFCGVPANKRPNNPNTDFAKGKSYEDKIRAAYEKHGLDWDRVTRVLCTWYINESEGQCATWIPTAEKALGFKSGQLEVLSFRDTVLPSILKSMGKSNFDDDVFRAISLLKEYSRQTGRILA